MRSSTRVRFAWLLVAAAGALFLLAAWQNLMGPSLEMTWDARTGFVTGVLAGGASAKAGVSAGDRIVSLNGRPAADRVRSLAPLAAGSPVTVGFERGGVRRSVTVVPETLLSARRRAFRQGPSGALWAAGGGVNLLVNLWMLLLGAFLLSRRPGLAAARVAALELAFWAGGNNLLEQPGVASLLAPVPEPARILVLMLDAFFLAMFFAACLHFALLFPEPLSWVRKHRSWQLAPYLAASPLLAVLWVRILRVSFPAAGIPNVPVAAVYQVVGPLLVLVSVGAYLARYRGTADLNARRKLRLLLVALMPGLAAFILFILLQRAGARPETLQAGDLLQWIGVAAGSGIFAYAVVRHRFFDIRILVRKSLQYALARGTLLLALALPAVALAVFLYRHRRESLDEIVSGRPIVYVVLVFALVGVFSARRRLMDALDRRFFREQYDARRMLLKVVTLIREGTDSLALANVALAEIEAALHPRSVSLWLPEGDTGPYLRRLAAGDPCPAPPLPREAAVLPLLASDDEPLELESPGGETLVKRLPESERAWIAETRAQLLAPLTVERRLVGLLLLSDRRSEEPYGVEERELLRNLAAHMAVSQDYARLKSSSPLMRTPAPPSPVAEDQGVRVCPSCRRCYPRETALCPRDESPLAPPEAVPYLIEEKYELRQLLGRGGMGSVFLATQKRLARPVAVKILLAHLSHDRDIRARFEREARVVAQLRHPAIVTVYDFGVLPSGNAYLVMEYLEGQTLSALLKKEGRLSAGRAVALLLPIAEALDVAHAAGVIHRDLKPDNIMVLPAPSIGQVPAKVLDFGVVRLEILAQDDTGDAAVAPTEVGTLLGTPAYMAPELFRRQPAGARSDQYSLGILAYELLSGSVPFPVGRDLGAAALAHTQKPVPPLELAAAHVPAFMARAVERALEKDPARRYPTARAFVLAMAEGMSRDDATPTVKSVH
jgi:GAF domain-containing protein/predicted Ser/Thr protein kinase